jgi:hypothetical protein
MVVLRIVLIDLLFLGEIKVPALGEIRIIDRKQKASDGLHDVIYLHIQSPLLSS